MNSVVSAGFGTETDPLEDADLLMEVCRALVSRPERVSVAESPADGGGASLLISVASGDIGKIIGKNGETIALLRKLFSKIGSLDGRRILVFVDEPQRSDFVKRRVSV